MESTRQKRSRETSWNRLPITGILMATTSRRVLPRSPPMTARSTITASAITEQHHRPERLHEVGEADQHPRRQRKCAPRLAYRPVNFGSTKTDITNMPIVATKSTTVG